ncbi:hypothetical protein C5C00_01025 [Rathayibacter rathayi]|uniref:hypothetical protein n=1 Tax=Rathayibacter rathayi TaxID=33887 RepID=UPI000CE7F02D|nr:hypothetical protein [Rathayibacter rathayi]PPG99157.1 hypothetical protein C5C00_01025 [Rathayibacter rathayi]
METSYGQVKKTLQVGAEVGAVSLLAGAVFVPLLILAVVAVIASAIVAAVLSGRPPASVGWDLGGWRRIRGLGVQRDLRR